MANRETTAHPIQDLPAIRSWISNRQPQIRSFPETFRRQSFFLADTHYTIQKPVTVSYRTPRSNKALHITLAPQKQPLPSIIVQSSHAHASPILSQSLSLGRHNLKIGNVLFSEHYLSMLAVLNLHIDCYLNQPSFPLPETMLLPFLQSLEKDGGSNLKPLKLKKITKKTFSQPFALRFDSNPDAYVIFYPHDSLVLDHQIAYSGCSVGHQRIQSPISPEFFSFVAQARTNLFLSPRQLKLIRWLQDCGGIPFWAGIQKNDILLATPQFLENPKSIFDGEDGHNYEFIAHEILDMLCWIKIVENAYECKWVGKLICYRFGHREQIATAKWLCNPHHLATHKLSLETV